MEVGDFGDNWDEAMVSFMALEIDESENSATYSRVHAIYDDMRGNLRDGGQRRYERIQAALNRMGLIREDYQVQFCNMVLDAAAKHIYREDFEACRDDIMKRRGVTEIRQEILVQTPRRFGKTTMVAMVVAALIAYCPYIKIGIFSTAQRTSKKMLAEVKKFLMMLQEDDGRTAYDRKCVENAEMLQIVHHKAVGSKSDADFLSNSIVYSYPASVKGTRGYTVDMTVLEEAAHMPEEIFDYVVVPALGTDDMVLIAITTPQDANNYFSRLTELKREDGELLFHVHAIGLACDACMAAGKGANCTHKGDLLPKWKPRDRQARIKAIYGEDKEDAFAQESQGMIVRAKNTAFDPELIGAALGNPQELKTGPDESKEEEGTAGPKLGWRHPPRVTYSFIDPSGGGVSSNYAVVTMGRNEGRDVVCTPSLSSLLQQKPDTGVEPVPYRLQDGCSAAELTGQLFYKRSLIPGSNRPPLTYGASALPAKLIRLSHSALILKIREPQMACKVIGSGDDGGAVHWCIHIHSRIVHRQRSNEMHEVLLNAQQKRVTLGLVTTHHP